MTKASPSPTAALVLKRLEQIGTRRTIAEMDRYGIVAKRAFGVPMGTLLKLQKELGTDHQLSLALWKSGWYEARLLAALIGDPAQVTRKQMDDWATGFENWGDCDTVCFKLFDRAPFRWEKAAQWASSPREFVKRGSFALMACLALHDKTAADARFLALLPLIERGARDDRNFVIKGVSWAIRAVGRRNPALRAAAKEVAERLAAAAEPSCRWIGKGTLRELAKVTSRPKTKARPSGQSSPSHSKPRRIVR